MNSFLEKGEHRVTDAVAWDLEITIRFVGAKGLFSLSQERFQALTPPIEKRTDNFHRAPLPEEWARPWNSGKATPSRTPGHSQQHRLRLIIEVVAQGDGIDPQLVSPGAESFMAKLSRTHLHREAAPPSYPSVHEVFHPEGPCQPPDELLVIVCAPTSEPVVNVTYEKLRKAVAPSTVAQLAEKEKEGRRVCSSRNSYKKAAHTAKKLPGLEGGLECCGPLCRIAGFRLPVTRNGLWLAQDTSIFNPQSRNGNRETREKCPSL